MNPIPIVHFFAAILVAVTAVPLIRRKVKMNDWYGIRIRASFESDTAWYEINHYGGCLLLAWSSVIAITAIIGSFAGRKYWSAYNLVALAIILGGLALVIAKIHRYARKRKST